MSIDMKKTVLSALALSGAATPEGPWSEVPSGGDPSMRFFKIVVELP